MIILVQFYRSTLSKKKDLDTQQFLSLFPCFFLFELLFMTAEHTQHT